MFTLRIQLADRLVEHCLELDAALPNEQTILSFLQAGHLYEPDVSAAFARILAPGDDFIDVGANIGYFTTLGALLVGPTGHVLGFEPDPRNLVRLHHNIGLNSLANVTILDRAASDQAGQIAFFINSDNAGGNALWDVGLFPGNHRSQAERRTVNVVATTLDAEFARLKLSPPKLIKIDTEGAEHHVLLGARDLLASGKTPYIIAELHEFGLEKLGTSGPALRAYMAGFGYETFALYYDGSLPRLVPPGTMLRSTTLINVLFSTQDAVARAWPDLLFNPLPPGGV